MAFLPIYPDDGLCFVAKETGTALTVHPHSSVWLVLSHRLPGSGHSWLLLADLGWTESLTQSSLLICKTWLKLARLQWNELSGNIGDKFLLLYKLLSINAKKTQWGFGILEIEKGISIETTGEYVEIVVESR